MCNGVGFLAHGSSPSYVASPAGAHALCADGNCPIPPLGHLHCNFAYACHKVHRAIAVYPSRGHQYWLMHPETSLGDRCVCLGQLAATLHATASQATSVCQRSPGHHRLMMRPTMLGRLCVYAFGQLAAILCMPPLTWLPTVAEASCTASWATVVLATG